MKATLTTGAVRQAPFDIRYEEETDLENRALVVAHFIRLGKRPAVGAEIGFSKRLQEVDETAVAENGDIDLSLATPVTDKIWCLITVTAADIDAAHRLINAQAVKYREAGGKVSQLDRNWTS